MLRTFTFSVFAVWLFTMSFLTSTCSCPAFGACDKYSYRWFAAAGEWSDADNWRHEEWNADLEECVIVSGVPLPGSRVYIQNGGTSTFSAVSSVESIDMASASRFKMVRGQLGCSNTLFVDFDSQGEQTGGELLTGNLLLGGWGGGWNGQFIHRGGTVHCSSQLIIGGLWISNGAAGTYSIEGTAQLFARSIEIAQGYTCNGTFGQDGGQVIADYIGIAGGADSTGSWQLTDGSIEAGDIHIGRSGEGEFIQTGGTVTVHSGVIIADAPKSTGSYELDDGLLQAERIYVGMVGYGDFMQIGGIVHASDELAIATDPNAVGTFGISGGELHTEDLNIGTGGTGCFVQTGGTVNIRDGMIAYGPNSSGSYELSGARLDIGGRMDIGRRGGRGSLVVDNGTIEGVIYGPWHGSAICVYPTGSLTGPGTYNIFVEYRSPEVYGTSHNDNVTAVFGPLCLTEGGQFSVEQLAPADFAGGDTSNLLESSVFKVDFEGEYRGEFTIVIPYDESEVETLDANEASLVISRETDDGNYEVLDDIFVDTVSNSLTGKSWTFGKFAVMTRKIYVLSVGVAFSEGPIKQDVQAERVRNAFASLPAVTKAKWVALSDTGSTNTALLTNEVAKAAKELSEEDIFIMYVGTHGFFQGGYDEPSVWAEYHDQNQVKQHRWSNEDEHMYLSDVNPADNISDDAFSALFIDAPWPKVNKLFIVDTCYAGGFWGDVTGLDSGDLGRFGFTRTALVPAAPEPNLAGTCLLSDGSAYVGKLGNAVIDALAHARYDYYSLSFENLVRLLRHYGQSYKCGPTPILGLDWNWDVALETGFNLEPRWTDDFSFMLPVRRSLLEGDLDDDGNVDLHDFTLLADRWPDDDCQWPDWCEGADIAARARDGIVDFTDLAILCDNWLAGTRPEF